MTTPLTFEKKPCPECGDLKRVQDIEWLFFRERVYPLTSSHECDRCEGEANWLKGDEYLCDEHAGAPTVPEFWPCGACT